MDVNSLAMLCAILALTEVILAWFAFGYRWYKTGAALAASVLPTVCLFGGFYLEMLRNSGKPTWLLGWGFLPAVPASLGLMVLTAAVCILLCALRRQG